MAHIAETQVWELIEEAHLRGVTPSEFAAGVARLGPEHRVDPVSQAGNIEHLLDAFGSPAAVRNHLGWQ